MTTGVFGASDWLRWSSAITIVWPREFRHSRGILTTDACCEEESNLLGEVRCCWTIRFTSRSA